MSAGNVSEVDTGILYDFCGGVPFWNDDKFWSDTPEISTCFAETVLVWVPHGYLWITVGPYLAYVYHRPLDPPLPWTLLQALKALCSVLLFCMAIVQMLVTETMGYTCDVDVRIPAAAYVATAVKAATILLALALQQWTRYKGVKSSGIPFCFWALLGATNIVPLYMAASAQVWCSTSTLVSVNFAVLWIQLFLHCFADQYNRRGYRQVEQNQCPEENASVLNKITFTWITSLVVTAYKRTLTKNEMWDQTRRLKSITIVPNLLRNWRAVLSSIPNTPKEEPVISYDRYRHTDDLERTPLLNNGYGEAHVLHGVSFTDTNVDDKNGKPSLFKALFKTFGWLWVEACCYKVIGDTFNLLQPIILQQIIGIIELRDTDPDGERAWVGYAYTVALFVTSMLKSLLYHCTFNHMIVLGLSVKTALIGAVYRKAMSMSNAAKQSSTAGEIVNLMSVDCQRIQDAFTFSHYIVSLPYMVTVGMVELWQLMGVAMVGGLAVVAVATAINGYIGRLQQHLQRQILTFKGKRSKILNEIINGIKVLKMYTWERSFQKTVTEIRQEEINRLRRYAILTAISIVISVHSPFMLNYVLVLIYTLSSPIHYLDSQTAFVVLSLVNILRQPITITPFVITGLIQNIDMFLKHPDGTARCEPARLDLHCLQIFMGIVSISRVQSFLSKADINEDNTGPIKKGKRVISVDDGYFSWDRRNPRSTLNRINMSMRQGQLFGVVGQVGCGKTSLISAILGEMEKLQGTVGIKGSIAYVPQEAWIQNLTVRDNILFGKPMDEERYAKVMSGCALLPDLEILSGGDMTEIGEKGINISGGQKQRISLARAAYSDADIYLLDDPLSAVDSHVGKHLFRNVIGNQGLLKHKTRILVTHGIHWLPMLDKILVMTDGQISETGTYAELISRNGPFAQFIQNFLDNDDDASDGDDAEVREIKDKIQSDVDIVTSGLTSDDNDGPGRTTRRRHRTSSGREKSLGMSFSRRETATKLDPQKDQAFSRLVQEEESQKGAVKFAVFQSYGKAMGYIAIVFVALFMMTFQSLNVYSNYWLNYWTEDPLLKNTSLGHTVDYENRFVWYLVWYTIIGVVQGAALLAFGVLVLTRMVRASGVLHGQMLECILRSPMSFFDTTPVGRIMNRFASDIDVMDDRLPLTFRLWTLYLFSMFATIIVVSINTPIFLVAIVPVAVIYLLLLKFYLPTARQVKRIESVLRSPIYNHFSETISGVSVIRAYRCVDRFIEESERRVDMNVKFFFAANSAARWVGVRLELLGNILVMAASLFALLDKGLNGAQVGLSITYALQITISLNMVIQAISEMEMNIVSAERIKEYTELPSEGPWTSEERRSYPDWPTSGSVEFRAYRTRYRPDLALVLRGINCSIRSGERIGIVGRTGAGKSSLTLSLFRLIEAAGGFIYIDGQDISQLGLHDLRSKITILPQDPVLFSGSLRQNLDPFGKFDDASMWKAIECAHLKTAVQNMPGKLEYECGEGGNNLSMGQRQLVCLARTLLHKTRILILDEATAAVDLETDELIQKTIRTEFGDCTIITIAHRLNTILDYDRVMVLGDGQILEIDEPGKLLSHKDSAFYKMAKDAGLVT